MTYVGGKAKLLVLPIDIDLQKLKEKVYGALRVDSTSYDLQMSMQATYGPNKLRGGIADIDDDGDVMGFIEYCRMNPTDLIPLYATLNMRTIQASTLRPNKDGHVGQSKSTEVVSNDPTIELDAPIHGKDDNDCGNGIDDYMNNDNHDHYDEHYDNDYCYDNGDNVENEDTTQNEIPVKSVHETVKQSKCVQRIPCDDGDIDRMKRMTDPFRWCPKPCDAPVNMIAPKQSNGGTTLRVNDIFSNKVELQDSLGKYEIENSFEWKVYKSNKSLFEVKCKDVGKCKWRARGIVIPGSNLFRLSRIDGMDMHACGRDQICPHHRQAGKRVAGILLRSRFDLENRVHRPKDIVFDFERDFSVNLSYMQAWRARHWALEAQSGSPEESFMLLPDYCEMLKSTNPGTVTHIETDDDDQFRFFFMAMGASLRGFKLHIRPVIAVDGTFLKGKYPGILYIAVGIDANKMIFPVAFGVGPKESNES
ncbi:uncharacterized protein [Euphorbia lathyris]|uniref:uncharacterized protein n=1 Tax=Euphorbia lathyris TaxID=212925 RepID=UPI00331382EE